MLSPFFAISAITPISPISPVSPFSPDSQLRTAIVFLFQIKATRKQVVAANCKANRISLRHKALYNRPCKWAYCSLFSWNRSRLIRIRIMITTYQIKSNRYLLSASERHAQTREKKYSSLRGI